MDKKPRFPQNSKQYNTVKVLTLTQQLTQLRTGWLS